MSRSNRLFINEVSSCVDEMLEGVVHSNPGTVLLQGEENVNSCGMYCTTVA